MHMATHISAAREKHRVHTLGGRESKQERQMVSADQGRASICGAVINREELQLPPHLAERGERGRRVFARVCQGTQCLVGADSREGLDTHCQIHHFKTISIILMTSFGVMNIT